ncbi:hypothetical protein EJD97_020241 [Solanum chilense]|uniref:Uncharacterized protein n=1 Tax=Solanum chilense TaxID=4083 RepID=A0A6N2AFE7_SOLCI|nr:hypothetical protein EJD97_020241 [Solanum chilense]
MNESSSSMRITRGSMVKSKQVQHEQTMEELRSKKKIDPMAVQEVINNAKVRGIKFVQGGRKRNALNIDSKENASEVDGSEEHHNHEVVA